MTAPVAHTVNTAHTVHAAHATARIVVAIRAARHFQFVAHGRLTDAISMAAFERDGQELADALAALGFTAATSPSRKDVIAPGR